MPPPTTITHPNATLSIHLLIPKLDLFIRVPKSIDVETVVKFGAVVSRHCVNETKKCISSILDPNVILDFALLTSKLKASQNAPVLKVW